MEALGAIALGSLIFSFVYWSFGFLRMTTTGFVAQADGAGQEQEVRNHNAVFFRRVPQPSTFMRALLPEYFPGSETTSTTCSPQII